MKSGTIAIAGAGIVGLSVAWRLAQCGWQVTVFDKSCIAGEASWAGAGMLAPGGEVTGTGELAENLIEARRMYRSFAEELRAESGRPIDFQQNGGLDLAYSPEELEELEGRRELQARYGIGSKILKPEQVFAFWPRINREKLAGGVFYSEDAVVDPRDVTTALAAACRARAVQLCENTAVQRVTTNPHNVTIQLTQGESDFDCAVIASGAWSNFIETMPPLPAVIPVKGVLLGYHQPDQTCSTIIRHRHTYLLQRKNGMLISGASVERKGFDRTINPEIVENLVAETSQVFPHLAETSPTEVWTGFRPYSDSPHVERWQNSRVFLAYGHFRNGILLAPHTAAHIAEMLEA